MSHWSAPARRRFVKSLIEKSGYFKKRRQAGRTSNGKLDAGPIIAQDVMRVTHRHSVKDLIHFGRDLEKVVLSRAIHSHIRTKIIVHEGRTVVFD